MNQRGFSLLILLILIFILVLIGVGGYFFINKFSGQKINYEQIVNTTPRPCTKTYHSDSNPESTKRLYKKQDKLIADAQYPKELTEACDEDLVTLACLEPYTLQANGEYIYQKTTIEGSVKTQTTSKAKEEVLDLITKMKRSVEGKDIIKVRVCVTDFKDSLLQYETSDTNNALDNTAHFATTDYIGTFRRFASISNKDIPYFSCDTPLQMTKYGTLYYKCGGGDGPSATSLIYKIESAQIPEDATGSSVLLKCNSSPDETGKVTTTCN